VALFGQVLYGVLFAFLILLWVRLIIDWVQVFARRWEPRGALLVILEGVYTVTDPPILAVRKIIPPVRLGSVALDLGFLIVMVVTYLLMGVVSTLF
jgi:YggT family protein